MELMSYSEAPSPDSICVRLLVNYGSRHLPWEQRRLEKIFKHLQESMDSLIFLHGDCCLSKEKCDLSKAQVKPLLLNSVASVTDPLTFEAHFKYDLDVDGSGPHAFIRRPHSSRYGSHLLRVDTLLLLSASEEGLTRPDLFHVLTAAVSAYLKKYLTVLIFLLTKYRTLPRTLTMHHFLVEDRLIHVLYPPPTGEETEWRSQIHEGLQLPSRPLLRRGMALFPPHSFERFLGPNSTDLVCPHTHLPLPGGDGTCEVVRGRYTYKHYLQDGADDKNWGCAYRSLQTLASWLLWQGIVAPVRELPSLRAIQESLVRVKDKPATFVGSRQWIGSLEVSFCLQELFGVQCRLIPIAYGAAFTATAASLLAEHFASGGGPVMVGGGQLAHTIVGVQLPAVDYSTTAPASKPKTRYLILDPHYTGPAGNLRTVLDKGWVGWKDETFWKPDVPYNLCLLPGFEANTI
ncbi:unnamed protein product [Schistocephalus solidus]|uniref:Ufm1-specific protease 2 n=3 Tax=Schistocephalus solidus TaxID=70667 RepID=A0A0V0J2I8_SCHSO|nr:unnamed protein product [Schistocephalus solidus]